MKLFLPDLRHLMIQDSSFYFMLMFLDMNSVKDVSPADLIQQPEQKWD